MNTLDMKQVKIQMNELLRFVDMMEIRLILKRNETQGVIAYSFYNEDFEGYRYGYVNYLYEGGDLSLMERIDAESYRSLDDIIEKFKNYEIVEI